MQRKTDETLLGSPHMFDQAATLEVVVDFLRDMRR